MRRCSKCGLPPPKVRDTIPLVAGLCYYCRVGIKPAPKQDATPPR